jgi:hypothetical protein
MCCTMLCICVYNARYGVAMCIVLHYVWCVRMWCVIWCGYVRCVALLHANSVTSSRCIMSGVVLCRVPCLVSCVLPLPLPLPLPIRVHTYYDTIRGAEQHARVYSNAYSIAINIIYNNLYFNKFYL